MTQTEGYETGEVCNRNGCIGIIEEHEKEGCCSCHINPPCSYCVRDNHFCPICNWSGQEEQEDYNVPPKTQEHYNKLNDDFSKRRIEFYRKYHSNEPVDKLERNYPLQDKLN